MFAVAAIILTLYSALISGTELTFELPDNEKQCFYEEIEEGVTFHVDYQVIAGGNYDVDCFVTDPLNNALYDERKKQYDSFTHTTAMKGVYKVCFSNEFSTFSHKIVYLDFRAGEQERLLPGMSSPTALTQIESTCLSIHEILKVVADTQTKYRLREAQDRLRAEDLNLRVSFWSIGEAVIICVSERIALSNKYEQAAFECPLCATISASIVRRHIAATPNALCHAAG
ncbi:transmembrane emp24 domain-containing protein 3-like [Clarias magur]|uniref:Transmembrane emp24 domain-containing protein 3-like n=1 Tax=Clarias magur TaxID=1594786 RepID=A0A8J4URB7_CLAMG|nr:transmembrane emp24 domain-containing protein 3-like [Clarias magur]